MRSEARKRYEKQELDRLIGEVGRETAAEWLSVLLDMSHDGYSVTVWDALRLATDIRRMSLAEGRKEGNNR